MAGRLNLTALLLIILLFLSVAAFFFTRYYFLAPMAIVAFGGLFYFAKYPEHGLLIVLVLVPFEIYKALLDKYQFLTLSKLVGILTLGIVLIGLATRHLSDRLLRTGLWKPVALLLMCYVISTFFSTSMLLSLNSLRQELIAVSIFCLTLLLLDRLNLRQVAMGLAISVAITSAGSIMMDGPEGKGDLDNRFSGFLNDPNYFALLIIVNMPLAGYLIISSRQIFLKFFWLLVLSVMMIAFFKTFSRSAVLVLGVLTLYWLYCHRTYLRFIQPRHIGLVLLLMLAGGPVLFLSIPDEYVERIQSLASLGQGVKATEDRSLGRRTSYILVGLDNLKKSPLTGVGPGTFPLMYSKTAYASAFTLNDGYSNAFRRAHNTYLELLTELGILGFACFLGLAWCGFTYFNRAMNLNLKLNNNQKAIEIFYWRLSYAGIVLFMCFLSAPNHKYFWFLLGVAAVLQRNAQAQLSQGAKT